MVACCTVALRACSALAAAVGGPGCTPFATGNAVQSRMQRASRTAGPPSPPGRTCVLRSWRRWPSVRSIWLSRASSVCVCFSTRPGGRGERVGHLGSPLAPWQQHECVPQLLRCRRRHGASFAPRLRQIRGFKRSSGSSPALSSSSSRYRALLRSLCQTESSRHALRGGGGQGARGLVGGGMRRQQGGGAAAGSGLAQQARPHVRKLRPAALCTSAHMYRSRHRRRLFTSAAFCSPKSRRKALRQAPSASAASCRHSLLTEPAAARSDTWGWGTWEGTAGV